MNYSGTIKQMEQLDATKIANLIKELVTPWHQLPGKA